MLAAREATLLVAKGDILVAKGDILVANDDMLVDRAREETLVANGSKVVSKDISLVVNCSDLVAVLVAKVLSTELPGTVTVLIGFV